MRRWRKETWAGDCWDEETLRKQYVPKRNSYSSVCSGKPVRHCKLQSTCYYAVHQPMQVTFMYMPQNSVVLGLVRLTRCQGSWKYHTGTFPFQTSSVTSFTFLRSLVLHCLLTEWIEMRFDPSVTDWIQRNQRAILTKHKTGLGKKKYFHHEPRHKQEEGKCDTYQDQNRLGLPFQI